MYNYLAFFEQVVKYLSQQTGKNGVVLEKILTKTKGHEETKTCFVRRLLWIGFKF